MISRLVLISFGLIVVYPERLAQAQEQLPPELRQKIDKVTNDALANSGVPSASIAVVKDGQIAYLQAYGNARLDPATRARPEMRYSIGSISKQFTATAILLLEEQGKLSLDDKVGKFIPDLTQANEVSIRELLSHTSGYQDYLAPRLCDADNVAARYGSEDFGYLGAQATRFRTWHKMAVQQYQLRDCRSDS
jgi:CubicO group peptidase (beta-lactamase class C family)